MATIPLAKPLKYIATVLRRVEGDERFTVTVAGHPAAEPGPPPGARQLAAPERLLAILAENPPDPDFAEDLRKMRQDIDDWGPAEDWSDWGNAARWDAIGC